ncbi:MAG: histidine kinase N-terminal 7TM domain-containing protein, partial [Dehalococcoidia bacterium]
MTVHEVAPLIQGSLGAGLLLLVLAKGGLSRSLSRWFVLFIVGEMLWGLAVFGLRASDDLDWALRWERFTPAAVSLTVISFYYFTRIMVRVPWPRWLTILAVTHFLASLASIPTSYLVEDVEVVSYGNTAVWGSGLIPWTLPVYLLLILSISTLYRGYRTAPSYTERNRLLLLVIAASISALGSLMDVAPVLGLDVPPATSWTNSIFFVLAAVAILRYNLLDIQVALQRRFSYVARSSANVALLAAGVLVFWLADLPVWSMAVFALALLLVAEPVWRKLDAVLRARLEKDLRSELQTLLNLGSGQTGANTLQVADTIVKLLDRVIHPAHSVLLIIQDGSAKPLVSQGYVIPPKEPLPANHLLIHWINNQTAPVFHDDLMVEP